MIKVEGITKLYGEQKALDNVSFEIGSGEVVGFLGPNGAGKSTMMKIVTGFISASKGEAWVDGIKVSLNSPRTKQYIGYLPENNPVYHDMYVEEYLRFVCGFYKLKATKSNVVKQAIEMTGLGPEKHKKIGALSKGYRQRVGLAQAIIPDPKVLILDEPTTGLDPNQVVDVRQLIIDLGKEKTVILSSHIMQEVQAMCQSAIILDHGQIKANAPVAELSQRIKGNQIIEIEFQTQPADLELFNHPSIQEVIATSDVSFRIVSAGEDLRPLLFQRAVDAGLVLLKLNEQGGSLEEVFREITG